MLRDHRFGTHYGNKVKEDYNEGDFFFKLLPGYVDEMRNVDSEHDKKYASYT